MTVFNGNAFLKEPFAAAFGKNGHGISRKTFWTAGQGHAIGTVFLNLNVYISQDKNCGHSITGTGFGHSFFMEKLRNDDSRKKRTQFLKEKKELHLKEKTHRKDFSERKLKDKTIVTSSS